MLSWLWPSTVIGQSASLPHLTAQTVTDLRSLLDRVDAVRRAERVASPARLNREAMARQLRALL